MITTIHIVATIIGVILGVFIGIVLYAETPEEESLICRIGWGLAGILVGVIVINFWAGIFSLALVIEPSEKTNKIESVKNLEIEIPDVNRFGTITVYDNDGMIYSYQGEIDILNDGTNGQPVEVVLDINENIEKEEAGEYAE